VYLFRSRAARSQVACGVPSQLLEFVAGAFAARIAGLWPSPHAAFLTSPAARRHLVCLALIHETPDRRIDFDQILGLSLKAAITRAVPAAPRGLGRALERMGEQAWSEDEYRQLLHLLSRDQPAKVLRHRALIAPEVVRALGRLPPALLDLGLGGLGLNDVAAGLVREAYTAVVRRDGESVGASLAQRWAKAGALPKLVEMIQQDLEPELPPPPFPGTERLKPLLTKAALEDAASRYKNCLRNHIRWAAGGVSAYYEWIGDPSVVLEINRDRLHGWTLDQARLAGNKPVPEPTRGAIIAELGAMGVYVGRTLWQLDSALDDVVQDPPAVVKTQADSIAEVFGD